MKNGSGQPLNYQLYSDSTRSVPLGTGTNSKNVILSRRTGRLTFSMGIYALLPRDQETAVPGTYESNFDSTSLKVYYGYIRANDTCSSLTTYGTLATFQVKVNIDRACNVTASDLNFGRIESLNSNLDATGTVDVRCANGLDYRVALDGGRANASSPAARQMSKGSDRIAYGLYQDANRTQPWGSSAGNTVADSGNGMTQHFPVHGRVFQRATPPSAGDYADTVVVTLTY